MRLFICIILTLGLCNFSASGCDCYSNSYDEWSFDQYDLVVVGTVVGVKCNTYGKEEYCLSLDYTIQVAKVYKGHISSELIVVRSGIGGGDCGFRFEKNSKYVVCAHEGSYMYKREDEMVLTTNVCTHTALVNDRDLQRLEEYAIRSIERANSFGWTRFHQFYKYLNYRGREFHQ